MMILRYETGAACAVVRGSTVVMVPKETERGAALRLWDQIGDDSGLVDAIEAVTSTSGSGLRGTPPFAIVSVDGQRAHVAVRGDLAVSLDVCGADGETERVVVSTPQVTTWTERVVDNVVDFSVCCDGPREQGPLIDDAASWPLHGGIVRADAVAVRLGGDGDDVFEAGESQSAAFAGVVGAGEPIAGTGSASANGILPDYDPLSVAPAPEPVPADLGVHAGAADSEPLEAPVAVQEPADTSADTFAEPLAEETLYETETVVLDDTPAPAADVLTPSVEDVQSLVGDVPLTETGSEPEAQLSPADFDSAQTIGFAPPGFGSGEATESFGHSEHAAMAGAPIAPAPLTDHESLNGSSNPAHSGEYGRLWDQTSMTGVEDAAVRSYESDAVPGSAQDYDHDGDTVMSATMDKFRSDQPGMDIPADAEAVLARVCSQGHANPSENDVCSQCGEPLFNDPVYVPRPPLGLVRFSSGQVITLDRTVIAGRRPRATPGTESPYLVTVASPQQDISRSHVEISLDGWHVYVTDLDTTNGTMLIRDGQQPVRLRPNERVVVADRDIIDLGDGVTMSFEGIQ